MAKAADDDIVLVEPHRDRFARRDFLAHPVVNPALDFRVGGRPLPGLRIGGCQVLNLPSGHDDFPRHTATAGFGDQAMGDEERSAQQEEVP